MIDVAALRKQAANKYPEVVEALLRGESLFPLKLRYARIKTTSPREDILKDREALITESKEHRGIGFTIEWEEVNTQKFGRNQMPGDLFFQTEDDYLSYVDKGAEVRAVRKAAQILINAFPDLRPVLTQYWRLLRDGSEAHWNYVVNVLRFFRAQPFPERYIRELPIETPTKFIEQHSNLIETLLGLVAPESLRKDGETFEERLGLKCAEALIECRLLDDTLMPAWHFRQFTVGLCDLEHLSRCPAHTFIITENRTNFLCLPSLPGTIALQGQGYAVRRLRAAKWLKDRRLLYWGDMDAHGFEILAILRREFPNTESVMMDAKTWEAFADYRVPGVKSRSAPEQFIEFLTQSEREMFEVITRTQMRLEQERIPQEYVEECLERALD